MGEWYYIGHYGQLGPLTREQVEELITGEVIARDTYVWKIGMADWVRAGQVTELTVHFETIVPEINPPPPPGPPSALPPMTSTASPFSTPATTMADPIIRGNPHLGRPTVYSNYPQNYWDLKSDKSRILGGVLQLLIPGVGRMYLGYPALGVLQLVFCLCGGLGYFWSFIDGIVILAGGVRMDGFGRKFGD